MVPGAGANGVAVAPAGVGGRGGGGCGDGRRVRAAAEGGGFRGKVSGIHPAVNPVGPRPSGGLGALKGAGLHPAPQCARGIGAPELQIPGLHIQEFGSAEVRVGQAGPGQGDTVEDRVPQIRPLELSLPQVQGRGLALEPPALQMLPQKLDTPGGGGGIPLGEGLQGIGKGGLGGLGPVGAQQGLQGLEGLDARPVGSLGQELSQEVQGLWGGHGQGPGLRIPFGQGPGQPTGQ